MRVIYTGAHGGFDTSRIPLGGGAAVMDALVREWSRTKPFELTILGVGDHHDLPHIQYVRLPVSIPKPLTELGELEYARFCREFERASTEWLETHVGGVHRTPTVVLSNDISEGPNFREVAAHGLPIATIFHVDVVEYVAKFYCHDWIKPERLTQLYRGLNGLRLAPLAPDVVRLIFEKQADCVRHSAKLILPSRGMADVLRRCYPGCEPKVEILPWGSIEEEVRSQDSGARREDLRAEFGVTGDELILLTLCRISPEKGIERLLQALIQMERAEKSLSTIHVFVCGAPAYMQGQKYMEQLRRLAAKLKTIRVHFVGHVRGERKRAFFALADLYVHLSHHESYGLTIAEAMRTGCPVLTTNHHSARDLVPADCGRIVSGHTEETVGVVRGLLADRPKLKAMGRAAAEHGRKLDFSHAASRLAELLTRLAPSGVSH